MKKLFVVLAFILFAEIMVNAQSDEEPGYFELIQQALDAKSAGAEDQALRLLYKATDVDSGRYPAYFQIGKIYFEKGLYEHAVKMFDRALKLRPEDYGSLYHKALAFSRQGRSGESAEVFGKINESYPSKTDYYYEYAWSCLKSYRIKKAEELALHLFKEKEDFYSSFLYANVLVFKEDYSGALNMYRSALEFSRKLKNNDLISLVYYNLAYLEKQFQNFDRAFEYIENSLSFTKRYTAYVLKGDIFLSTGDFEEAYTAYSTAYSISPVALTKLKMAEIFILQGKLDDAEMFLKHIDEAFNKDKISLYSLSVSIESFLSELNRMRRLLVRARFSHDKIFNRGGFLSGVVDWFDSLSFKASEKYYMNLYRKYLIKDGLNMVAFNDNVSGFISLAYANIEYKKIALKYFQKAKNSSEDDLRI
jgi:tetratricopeptide (TPR) repeat protein